MVDPAVWPVWLSHVREMQPLFSLMAESPLTGIAIAAFPCAALVATIVLARAACAPTSASSSRRRRSSPPS